MPLLFATIISILFILIATSIRDKRLIDRLTRRGKKQISQPEITQQEYKQTKYEKEQIKISHAEKLSKRIQNRSDLIDEGKLSSPSNKINIKERAKELAIIENNYQKERAESEHQETILKEKVEKEYKEKILNEKIESERQETILKEKAEKEYKEKILNEKIEKERLDKTIKKKAEKEQLDITSKEKAEKERLDKISKEKVEKEHLDITSKEKTEKERLDKISKEKTEIEPQTKILIPKNPKTNFIQGEDEEEAVIKFIGYEPPIKFEQREPLNYPMAFMPKPKSIIKFPRKGKQGLKGYTEDSFKYHLLNHFKSIFQIYDDRFILYKSNQNPFEPDFTLIDESNGLNIFIDIEIDEPYDGISRQPIHFNDYDNQRNTFFNNRGWIVIRFAEFQIFKTPLSCCRFIYEVVKSINPHLTISDELSKVDEITQIEQWTKLQAVNWSNEKYREKYLGIDRFYPSENLSIFKNLLETNIGNEIENQVINENADSIEYKRELILRAINNKTFLSCKIFNNYTVVRPIRIENNVLLGFCYLNNSEINYEIIKITDLILREKPFLMRINGAVGVEEIKSFILKYIGRKNPIRIKYTRGAWPELLVDEETGEVYFASLQEREQSLRTVSDIDLVSKLIPLDQIRRYNMNDNNYIAGFCHLRKELRNFRYDRINELEILNI